MRVDTKSDAICGCRGAPVSAAMSNVPKILLLLSSMHGGGAERVAAHLVNRCDPKVVDVRIALLRRAGPFLSIVDPARLMASSLGENWLAFEGHNSSFYHPGRLLAAATLAPMNLRAMIDEFRPDVVVSFLKGMALLTYAVLPTLSARPRWILREGNNTDAVIDDELTNPAGRRLVKAVTRLAYRRADAFLANSHEMSRGLQETLRLDAARMRVIQNPIHVAEVKRRSAAPLIEQRSRPYIVTAGRLEYQKGHDDLLRVFARSHAARDHDLVILGQGSLLSSLKELAITLGVADRVFFPGFSTNPWAWIAKAELFVLPSRWEGFPSIVAETLACAAPALVTACDFGPAEVVEHGVSGWVVPPHDELAFGDAMERLLNDPGLRRRLAEAGPARAASFDIDQTIQSYTALFVEQAELRPSSVPRVAMR